MAKDRKGTTIRINKTRKTFTKSWTTQYISVFEQKAYEWTLVETWVPPETLKPLTSLSPNPQALNPLSPNPPKPNPP